MKLQQASDAPKSPPEYKLTTAYPNHQNHTSLFPGLIFGGDCKGGLTLLVCMLNEFWGAFTVLRNFFTTIGKPPFFKML